MTNQQPPTTHDTQRSGEQVQDVAGISTRDLLTELALRMEYRQNSLRGRHLGRLCFEAIANLDAGVLVYRRTKPWTDEQTARFAAYIGRIDAEPSRARPTSQE